MTVCTWLVVLVSCWLMEVCAVATEDSPVTLLLGATVQVYVVPVGTISSAPLPALVGDTVKVSAEQMAVVLAAISGVGFTRTVRSKELPTQVPLLGVSS